VANFVSKILKKAEPAAPRDPEKDFDDIKQFQLED
jgi:hypothetical protein